MAGTTWGDAADDHNLNNADGELTFWFIPQAISDDLILNVEFRVKTPDTPNGTKIIHTINLGELLNEKLWADVLDAGAHGIVLKTGELLTRSEVMDVMSGKRYVFNEPVLEKLVERFRKAVTDEKLQRSASIEYEIDEYDERFLRHLALGYTKDMISELRTMPFSSKSLEKRQADLVMRLFPEGEQRGVNVTRLVVRAIELHIIDPSNLIADE